MTTRKTYRAMQVSRPGVLELVERTVPEPGAGEVLLQVEACGICGADASDIERPAEGASPPRVPGHDVVGRIVALGANTPSLWKPGQRVGVGRLGGHCHVCAPCRQGRFNLCQNQPVVGSTVDGGYAEMMLARSTGLVAIPEELASEEAAPLLCAGIATFNALKKCGAQAGDLLVGGERHVAGSLTGSPHDSEKTLNFSVLADVRPQIEVLPLEQANAAYQKMKSGQAKFRMVLTMHEPR